MNRDPLAPQLTELHAEVANLAATSILLALRQRILRQAIGEGPSSKILEEPVSHLVMRAARLLAEIEQAKLTVERLDRRMLH